MTTWQLTEIDKLSNFLDELGIKTNFTVSIVVTPARLEMAIESARANGLRLMPTDDDNRYHVISNEDTMPIPELSDEVVFHD